MLQNEIEHKNKVLKNHIPPIISLFAIIFILGEPIITQTNMVIKEILIAGTIS